jgi:hypothetical protein
MSHQEQLTQKFQSLQQEAIKNYEDRVHEHKRNVEGRAAKIKSKNEQKREIMKSAGIDLAKLDKVGTEEEAELQKFLGEQRKSIIEKSGKTKHDSMRLAMHPGLEIPGARQLNILGATLLAPRHGLLDNNPGEKGNPWVTPWNPGNLKIKNYESGDGSGCWAQADVPDVTAIVWYNFIPDSTGVWNLPVLTNFHGYYIARANDTWDTCKSCDISVKVEVNAFQYFWNGAKKYTVLHKSNDNIEEMGLIDEYGWFDYSAAVRAGDWVFVQETITLSANAHGGGSYGEVNFSDGLNVIEPLIVIAYPQ